MERKTFMFGNIMILFTMMFIFTGCPESNETVNGGIEVYDSSTPPKFLGYDTGLGYDKSRPIIRTSKGYCVQLMSVSSGSSSYVWYGQVPPADAGADWEEWDTVIKNRGWGYSIFFLTANPVATDTPYAISSTNIMNEVFYNPHNGGTYYTQNRDVAIYSGSILGTYKFYDNHGTMRTINEDIYLGEWRGGTSKELIDNPYFVPLKKIGGYAEIGLPNPATIKPGFVYNAK